MNINYKHLKKMRELSGLTQVQLGERLGLKLTPSTKNPNRLECSLISQYENGSIKKIPFDFAKRWAVNCGFELHSESNLLVKFSEFNMLLRIESKYSNLTKALNTRIHYTGNKFVTMYKFINNCVLIPINEYFDFIEVKKKYEEILKITNK